MNDIETVSKSEHTSPEFKQQVDDLHQQMLKDIVYAKAIREKLLAENEMLDEDGYPTKACLEIIANWHWSDSKGWFEFIKENWWYANIRWNENTAIVCGEEVIQYSISTSGWSGNESIIAAMQNNGMLWTFTWVQSRRGGHYIFEDREFEEGA